VAKGGWTGTLTGTAAGTLNITWAASEDSQAKLSGDATASRGSVSLSGTISGNTGGKTFPADVFLSLSLTDQNGCKMQGSMPGSTSQKWTEANKLDITFNMTYTACASVLGTNNFTQESGRLLMTK
jgi:hypothetical protein